MRPQAIIVIVTFAIGILLSLTTVQAQEAAKTAVAAPTTESTSAVHKKSLLEQIKEGGWVMVPIGVPHTFGNARTERVRFLATMSPDFYVRYFDEIAPLFSDGPPDPKAVGQIMARYATDAQIP